MCWTFDQLPSYHMGLYNTCYTMLFFNQLLYAYSFHIFPQQVCFNLNSNYTVGYTHLVNAYGSTQTTVENYNVTHITSL